ncbi:hypothetical protein EZV62_026369 [Acer yangbiense]|uniref:NB-ARC domain-containing protein n=1 Tax=Acer yangbiense TaxID=1000413 RepID=A0A5C7GR98_9ROSI|nr:hypothetical protein EZV62_026369 [Acer yangbiense]
MVDAVVSFVVDRLGDFLINEAVFLCRVKKEVKRLKEELGSMQHLLKDAEEKQYGDPVIHKWVSDIKELSYDIEDMLYVFRLKVRKPKWGCFPCVCSSLFDIGKQIEDFRKRINDLSPSNQPFRLKDSGNSPPGEVISKLRDLRRSVSFAVEENVVGFVDEAHKLLAKLLAFRSFHLWNGRRKFENRAWVAVSQEYTTRDLLTRIFKSFEFKVENNEDLEKMNEEDLKRRLHKSLQGYSYLLVIDDVWDKESWWMLKTAFPDNKNGSRVIITTRNEEVAKSSDENTHSHHLRNLREEESWQLFCQKNSQIVNVDEELKRLCREMVQKCNGLPLAIIVLGGLLSNKKQQEWHRVRDHLWRHLKAANSIEINSLLVLSFNSLPYQLKPCFLYLGLFPEDSEIIIEKLIYLWVAEGFISEGEDCIMEEVAKDYINELINRSLIQVERRYWGRTATCRVHDLLRDLAIDMAKKTFSYLRVLDIGIVPSRKHHKIFDKEIAKLIHLKYLGWYTTRIDASLIYNLQRLQTLVIYGVAKLSTEISRLQELRHLIGVFYGNWRLLIDNLTKLQTLRHVSLSIWAQIKTEKLVNLRGLWLVGSYSKQEVFCFDSIANLKSLRILVVRLTLDDMYFSSLQPLSHCGHLMDLRLKGKLSEKVPEDIHQVLPNLECLTLERSYLQDDPMPMLEKLPKLTVLKLGGGFYKGKKMMSSANGFLWLEILLLVVAEETEEWQVEDGAFSKLKGFYIEQSGNSNLNYPKRLRSLPSPDLHEFQLSPYFPLD